ncbi:hypothetical protein J6590_025055 [Homalodisca vitripennis]|nr:hypothetical protein J6590_025055 [Homalodisca vitripennis]
MVKKIEDFECLFVLELQHDKESKFLSCPAPREEPITAPGPLLVIGVFCPEAEPPEEGQWSQAGGWTRKDKGMTDPADYSSGIDRVGRGRKGLGMRSNPSTPPGPPHLCPVAHKKDHR